MESDDGHRIKTTSIRQNEKEDNDDDDDDEEEEHKIEKFYALIRRCREAQHRRRMEFEMQNSSSSEREKKKMKTESSSSWIPAFKWEDFKENQVEFGRAPMVMRTPCCRSATTTKKHEDEEEINPNPILNATQPKPKHSGLELDLNLSL